MRTRQVTGAVPGTANLANEVLWLSKHIGVIISVILPSLPCHQLGHITSKIKRSVFFQFFMYYMYLMTDFLGTKGTYVLEKPSKKTENKQVFFNML